jgi:hypothetical protein
VLLRTEPPVLLRTEPPVLLRTELGLLLVPLNVFTCPLLGLLVVTMSSAARTSDHGDAATNRTPASATMSLSMVSSRLTNDARTAVKNSNIYEYTP